MRHRLARFEARLEQLVEGTLTRWMGARLHPNELLARIGRAMEDCAQPDSRGTLTAPSTYTVRLHPSDAGPILDGDPAVIVQIQQGVVALAREAGLVLRRVPSVTVVADDRIPPRGLAVECADEGGGDTQSITPITPAASPPIAAPTAYLIVDGDRHVRLDQPIMSIGRRLSNQIILDDARVSRAHAQIRLRHGRFVLYDLGSRSGTRVNDRPITEWPLTPGDVISLADARLIYVEEVADATPDAGPSLTQPLPPQSPGVANVDLGDEQ